MEPRKINVLQFICPVGFYGAERWILALVNNADPATVRYDLAVTDESADQNLEIVNHFSVPDGLAHKIKMRGRFDWAVIRRLVDIIRERQIDIIHTHGYKSDILGLIAAKKAGIRAVSTPHGFGIPNDLKLKLFVKAGAFALRYFDKVVPLSLQLLEETRNFGVAEDKLLYIRNGVDLRELDQYREQRAANSDGIKRIGFIGQLIPRKNVRDILDIFEQVHRHMDNTRLQLLGDGPSRAELEAYADKLTSRPAIEFLGFRNDRMEFLRQFDLFVMTSLDEGIPRCLMEAMGMGVPVAAYDISGVDQLVSHEQTGLLAQLGDKETLTGYWNELLSDSARAALLAENARDFVDENFSGARMAREYLALFNDLVKR